MVGVGDKVARVTTDKRTAAEWALVLSATGIAHEVRASGGEWLLLVASEDAEQAAVALDAYERENQEAPVLGSAALEYGRTSVAIVVAIALLLFHWVTRLTGTDIDWVWRGSANAFRVLQGELWRTVTALTLHTGFTHVAGNAVSCAIFGTAVCRAVGPGVGLWLMLLAGALGNTVNLVVHGSPHNAVGASTAIFGAVGVLGALQFMKRYRFGGRRRRAWVPVAAALALLAMLGTGPRSDILAHLFGLIAGGVLGIGAAVVLTQPPRQPVQWTLAAGALVAVVASWVIALR